LTIILLFSGCQEKTYDYGFSEGGIGGEGWPVWGEYLIVNEAWQVPVGNLPGGTVDNIPVGSQSGLGRKPVPKTLRARWFSYRNQTFYEVTVVILEARQTQIKQWLKQYPTDRYLHELAVGFAGQGELQAWWTIFCKAIDCPKGQPKTDHFELTPRTKAKVAEGDPSGYRDGTLSRIKDGRIPEEVMELLLPAKEESAEDKALYESIMNFVPGK
ncbi:DUF2931 family protein, partial [Gynuella sp.]|uniref:DUF2931 family protein n=1 Tax=Gynuella sp. TaxID=2969146 RepID=UPI003D1356F5